MEYSHLLDQADECEDPYLQLVYAGEVALLVYLRLICFYHLYIFACSILGNICILCFSAHMEAF